MKRNPRFPWGNLPSSEGAIRELGVIGALQEADRLSSHRSSSGRTSSIQRKGGRKARQAHYTRKAISEKRKEAARRAAWERRHPGASESNWLRRQEKRKTRKAANRALIKAMKKRRTPSK
jgi:hypothetical protein